MVGVLEGESSRKQKAAQALLGIGGAALLVELWTLWLEASTAWTRGAEQSLGWIGALGTATLQLVNFVAWNPQAILLSIARLLLLCWPVAVMLAGVALSRRS